jgi:hypothetical protein
MNAMLTVIGKRFDVGISKLPPVPMELVTHTD